MRERRELMEKKIFWTKITQSYFIHGSERHEFESRHGLVKLCHFAALAHSSQYKQICDVRLNELFESICLYISFELLSLISYLQNGDANEFSSSLLLSDSTPKETI